MQKLWASAALALASAGSWAELVDRGNTTYDTASGLEWLDLSFTNGMSFGEVRSSFATAGSLYGYRYATQTELFALLPQLDVPVLSNYYSPYTFLRFPKFDAYLGFNIKGLGPAYAFSAMTGDNIPGFPGYHFIASAGPGGINTYTPLSEFAGQTTLFPYLVAYEQTWAAVWESYKDSQLASFVVREVSPIPEPATYWMMMLGVVALSVRRFRQRANL